MPNSMQSFSAGASILPGVVTMPLAAGAHVSARISAAFSCGAFIVPFTTTTAIGAGANVFQPTRALSFNAGAFIALPPTIVRQSFGAVAFIAQPLRAFTDRVHLARARQRTVTARSPYTQKPPPH